ncbi:SIN3 [Ecytonucleospora hepatopenaei]|uniref:SIN3 n=1 Tax=Ecytonucleospora hepatopenaei TaxID=646526 RepID=A0A1W0E6B2_9MICR|nr:SIN3 [Ecytonucleospora hepatopenaei]
MSSDKNNSAGSEPYDVKKRRLVESDTTESKNEKAVKILNPFRIENNEEDKHITEESEKQEIIDNELKNLKDDVFHANEPLENDEYKNNHEDFEDSQETKNAARKEDNIDRRQFTESEENSEDISAEMTQKQIKQEENPNIKAGEAKHTPDDADLTDAMVFLNKIKDDYSHNVQVYDQFLETMRDFKFGKIDSTEVCKRIRILFKENPHLIRSFEEYLPHHLKTSFGSHMMNRGAVLSGQHSIPYRNVPNVAGPLPYQPASVPPYVNAESIPRQPYIPNANYPPHLTMGRQMNPIGAEGHRTMPQIPLGAGGLRPPVPVDRGMKNEKQQIFVEKLKQKYTPSSLIYSNVIDAMLSPNVTSTELYNYVKEILKNDPELFNDFKSCCDLNYDSPESLPHEIREKYTLEKIKNIMEEKGILGYFTMILNYYNQDLVSGKKLFYLLDILIDNKEYIKELKNYLKYSDKDDKAKIYNKSDFIGSYVEKNAQTLLNQESATNLEINDRFVCLNTLVSEETVYVVRNKNYSEEYLVRLGDDRSEFDVQIQRLKCFICRLFKLYALLPDEPKTLDISDLDMSTSIVRDVLKMIYGKEENKILEKILENSKAAIPKIIKRCCVVYKEFLTKQKENRLNWRFVAEQHYYKAYDIDGIDFRNSEKNNLTLRHIKEISKDDFSIKVTDRELLKFLSLIIKKYVSCHSNQSKVVTIQQKVDFFKNVFANINNSSFEYSVSLEYYGLYFYILTLYNRLKELKETDFKLEQPSKVAIKLGLVEPNEYETSFSAVLEYCRLAAEKSLDNDSFEEKIRIVTKCKGFKLYNFKKILNKLDKWAIIIIEKALEKNEDGMDLFNIHKNNSVISLKRNAGLAISEEANEFSDRKNE